MGMEQRVEFGAAGCPPWPKVAALLAEHSFAVQVRMIDAELAFPDEAPPEEWRELRIGTPGGMITILRESNAVRLVTWGNADAVMRQGWNALTWAFAEAGAGTVITETGPATAEEFRQRIGIFFGVR